MATAIAQPTSVPPVMSAPQTYTPPNSQGHHPQIQFAPTSAASTPSTQSPSSTHNVTASTPTALSHLPLAQRQIHPPKSSMYVPAALRPTDRPSRSSPLTPPRSVHGSTDNLQNPAGVGNTNVPLRPVSRRSTEARRIKTPTGIFADISSSFSPKRKSGFPQDLDFRAQGQIKGTVDDIDSAWFAILPPYNGAPPTTHHWKPDSHAILCDGPTCHKAFGLFERRHHCRHCGNIFCGQHSSMQIPLDQNAEFHPLGSWVRSCEHCSRRYEEWGLQERRAVVTGKRQQEGSEGAGLEGDVTSPLPTTSTEPTTSSSGEQAAGLLSPVRSIDRGQGKAPEDQKGGVASSVSRNWNWSTF